MRLFTRLLVTVELVNSGWQFPPSQLSRQPRAHSPRKELSRRSRSLHQDLFLSREARDNEEVDEESNRLSQAHPPFSRMLEHSWQPEVGDSICSSQFVPNICACSSGDADRSKPNTLPLLPVEVSCTCPSNLRRLTLHLNEVKCLPNQVNLPLQGQPPTKHQTLLGLQLLLP